MKLHEVANHPNPEINRIKQELRRLGVLGKSTILPDMSVDVNGDVALQRKATNIPVQFNRVNGYFGCYRSTLITSLQGSPRYVRANFSCSDSGIATLEYAPVYVGDGFTCSHTPNMKSLHGVEKWIPNIKVGGTFTVIKHISWALH